MPKKVNVKGPIVGNNTALFYDWIGWECTSPNTIAKALEEADGEDVILEINSPGGIVVYGYEMYSNLMEYEGHITAHVISAASAATMLVCAADEALISDAGIFMIHNAQSSADGDYRDLQMEANALREIDDGIINAYVRKTGMSREDIQNLMDNSTYMSPQTAIQYGFIDGYMFGDPNEKEAKGEDVENLITNIAAADLPVIPESKAKELMMAIKNMEKEKVAPVQPLQQPQEVQNIGGDAVSDNKKNQKEKKGEVKMTLEEMLAANPEVKAEIDALTDKTRAEGAEEERARLKSLDAIAGTVKKEALDEAKYGENPINGQELAYQAMLNGDQLATAYMTDAKDDVAKSGSDKVGVGNPDAGQEPTNEADEMAAYVNKVKGGKQE